MNLSARPREDGSTEARAFVELAETTVTVPTADLVVSNVALEGWVPTSPELGEPLLLTARVHRGGRAAGFVSAAIDAGPGGAALDGALTLAAGPAAWIRASIEGDGDGWTASASIDTTDSAIRDPEAFAALLGLDPGDAIGGDVAIDVRVRHAGGALTTSGSARLDAVTISRPGAGLSAAGIQGAVAFERLWPPVTRGAQRISIGPARVGRIGFLGAQLDVALDGSGDALVERSRWITEDGARFKASPFRIDPSDPGILTTVRVEGLNLAHWVPLLTDGRASGTGTLSGRIPFRFRRGRIAFGEGFLAGTPGGGVITVDDAGRLGELLEMSDPRFRTDPDMQTIKERLIGALGDFRYDVLRLDLVPQRGGTLLRVHTSGRGPRTGVPQEIGGLTLNIHTIDVVISELLSIRAVLGEAADRALERFFDD